MLNNSIMQTNIGHVLLCQISSSCCSSSAVLSTGPLDFLSFRSSQEHTSKNWMLIMAPNALASLRLLFWTTMTLSSFKSPREQYLGIQRWISWLSKHWSEKGVSTGATRIIVLAVLIMSALTVRLHAHTGARALRVLCSRTVGRFHDFMRVTPLPQVVTSHVSQRDGNKESRGNELFWFRFFWTTPVLLRFKKRPSACCEVKFRSQQSRTNKQRRHLQISLRLTRQSNSCFVLRQKLLN